MKQTAQKTPKTQFWLILALINVAALIYPIGMYVHADSNDAKLFAMLVVLAVGFVLAITDTVGALVAYMG